MRASKAASESRLGEVRAKSFMRGTHCSWRAESQSQRQPLERQQLSRRRPEGSEPENVHEVHERSTSSWTSDRAADSVRNEFKAGNPARRAESSKHRRPGAIHAGGTTS